MNPTTVSDNAQFPRQTERRGGTTVAYTRMHPRVIGGQCEWCGVLDNNQESIYQYKICPHFRGMQTLECSYCDPTKNPEEVIRSSVMKIHDHPTDKDEAGRPKLVVVCDSYECSSKHLERFKIG